MNEDIFYTINVHVLHGSFFFVCMYYEVPILIDLLCDYDRVTFSKF